MANAEKLTFFYRTGSPFSQFHPSEFTSLPMNFHPDSVNVNSEEPKEFLHCEMWMMFNKAKLFGDEDVAQKILNTREPQKCKALGRKVKNFDQSVWNKHNKAIIYEGNRLKFTQNGELLKKLMDTKGTTLVEASPTDRIYGIGLSADDPRAKDRRTWRGRNLLGQVLTELRDNLDKELSK